MSVPAIEFPVPFEKIPELVKSLTEIIAARQADIEVARTMLKLARAGCKHVGAEHGHNDRDGSWMNACPHCGATA